MNWAAEIAPACYPTEPPSARALAGLTPSAGRSGTGLGRSAEMETSAFLDAIRGDLQAVTAGDVAAAAVAERLSRALESSLQLRLLDAMGQAALELSNQLLSGHVEVRVSGRDVGLVLVETPEPAAAPAPADHEGGTARLTLRMPNALKARVEQASGREGLSTNAWLVRTVTRGLDHGKRT